MGCRKLPEPAQVSAGPAPEVAEVSREETPLSPDGDLNCLLATPHGRINLQFGYRGCFGGSDNDLDLDVAATASLSGHLWTGISTNRSTEGAKLTLEQGRAYLRRLVGALVKEDEATKAWTTTKAFVRVSYWCGAHREGPLMFETEAPSEVNSYSRVHATIAAARKILESAPGRDSDSPEQQESARRRSEGLYENGVRVRHDPVEQWKDP
jgi:hypothetical protein